MMPFSNIRPRRFNHIPIYSDERKERLRDIEERARRELGLPSVGGARKDLHGVFSSGTSRRHPSRGYGNRYRGVTASCVRIVIIAVLSVLMYRLLTVWLMSY